MKAKIDADVNGKVLAVLESDLLPARVELRLSTDVAFLPTHSTRVVKAGGEHSLTGNLRHVRVPLTEEALINELVHKYEVDPAKFIRHAYITGAINRRKACPRASWAPLTHAELAAQLKAEQEAEAARNTAERERAVRAVEAVLYEVAQGNKDILLDIFMTNPCLTDDVLRKTGGGGQ